MEKKKALVIDDEQVVLESVRKMLTAENYEVDVSLIPVLSSPVTQTSGQRSRL